MNECDPGPSWSSDPPDLDSGEAEDESLVLMLGKNEGLRRLEEARKAGWRLISIVVTPLGGRTVRLRRRRGTGGGYLEPF